MYSTYDDVILYGDLVWGTYTSSIVNEDMAKVYKTPEYTHIHMRDETAAEQYNVVTNHKFTSSEEISE